MRTNMILLPLLLSCAQVRHTGERFSLTPEQRSAIVIVLDDVGYDDLASVATPNLDALAARGVTFSNAYANPTCSVTRRSLLFGHWQLQDSGPPCAPATPHSPTLDDWCLPRLVPQASILAGKYHLGGDPLGGTDLTAPLTHGFLHWIAGSQANLNDCGGSNYWNWKRVEDGVVSTSHAYEPDALSARVRFWWSALGGSKLFVVAPALAHGPMHAPPANLLPPGYVVGPSQRQKYEAMIVALDTIIGEILAEVDEETLVIVIGDNGTPINVSPDPDRSKTTTFERGIHVPLIIAGGTVASPGRASSELVHAVDVYETVLNWCGGSHPANPAFPLVGASLLPTLEETTPHAYHEYVLCGNAWNNPDGDRCARSLGWKLRQLDDDGDEAVDREELYDMVNDPFELLNVLAVYPAQAQAMRNWIEQESP